MENFIIYKKYMKVNGHKITEMGNKMNKTNGQQKYRKTLMNARG